MGGFSWWHWAILLVVVLVVFGGKGFKVSEFMGDVAKGIKSFKKGLADDPAAEAAAEKAKTLEQPAGEAVNKATDKV
jgi:sec-independent protein translocase protein TatA